jgi:HD superfamily phosphohydrolase
MMVQGEIADILSSEFSPREIAGLCGKPLGGIITSDIGADRMDYLLRDSHYTGVAYGVIDSERVCGSLSLSKKGLHLRERGLEAGEGLLVARFAMFSTVYLHKTVRIASRMLQHAMVLALEDGAVAPGEFLAFSDAQALAALGRSRNAAPYARRLSERRLFKKAHSFPMGKMGMGARKAERELSGECGCTVLIDVPALSAKAGIMLEKKDGSVVPLARESDIVSSLAAMQSRRLEALAICEEKNVKKVARASERLFG